jgi:hypothetical protein
MHIPDEAMSDQAHDWTDEQIASLSAKIRETYEQAAKEMEQRLGTWLSDYDHERRVMEERMRQGYITYTDYKKWLEDMAMERSWQQAMIDSLTNDAVNADVMCRQLINDELPTIFAENANFGAYDVDTKLGYDTGFTLVDRDTVMRLIKDNPELLPTPDVDKAKDTRWNRSKFASAVTQGVLQGESVPRMAQRLGTVFGMDERASVRAARTSFTSAENAGRISSYERAKRIGINMQQEWLATLDMRTRHTHRLLDGQKVPVGGYFEPDGYGEKYRVRFPADPQGLPEMVWNCRCTLVAAVAGVDTSDAERWSKLPEGMTYDDWKGAKKGDEGSKKESGERQSKPTSVNGKNLIGTWQRDKDRFNEAIYDVVEAQGFNGKPTVVNKSEFEQYAKDADMVMVRGYMAPDDETLKRYARELRYGEWYIDAGIGGAVHGQGMYTFLEEGRTAPSKETLEKVKAFSGVQGIQSGKVELMTVIDNFKSIDETEIVSKFQESALDSIHHRYGDDIWKVIRWGTGNAVPDDSYGEVSQRVYANNVSEYSSAMQEYMDASRLYGLDNGSAAALMGYDGVRVKVDSGTYYMVVLNRTKLVILE